MVASLCPSEAVHVKNPFLTVRCNAVSVVNTFFKNNKKYEDISALIVFCPSFFSLIPCIRPYVSQPQASNTASASSAEYRIQHHLLSQRLFIPCFLRFTIPQVRRTSSPFNGRQALLEGLSLPYRSPSTLYGGRRCPCLPRY